jgi:two-component system, OmpR family, response regulator MprA
MGATEFQIRVRTSKELDKSFCGVAAAIGARSYLLLKASCHHSPMRILIVEDEAAVRAALTRALETEGYELVHAEDGVQALAALAHSSPDAVVLDVMLPGVDGLEVARRARAQHNPVPILMLTARGAVGDRVAGLDAGADDYLVKPFALEELLARLRALLRRAAGGNGELSFADLALDPGTREVRRGKRPLELTVTEFNLLELFLRNPRQVLRRSLIYDRVWGYDFGPGSHALDVYIGYLRRKLEADGEPRLIHTARGVGYALREP